MRLLITCMLAALSGTLLGACLSPSRTEPQPPPSPPAPGSIPATSGAREFSHTSAELVAALRFGWNLGNSLDAPEGETAWGNPKATPALFRGVAQAGFRLVRIPVTWAPHLGQAPEFRIDRDWLLRVDEVVRAARGAGLYAVINLHHDGADGYQGVEWLTLNDAAGKVSEENNAAVRARFVKVWTQIAEHFAEYGEELLFESMNEIHDGYGAPDPRYFPIVNQLNQAFVGLVRASGGNNAKRHLVVPGYNTNIEHTLAGFEPPRDPTPNRLLLSVHYYDPYLYALMGKTKVWGKGSPGADDWGQEAHVVERFDQLKARFVDRGLPVLLGEYGATKQAGFEDHRRYYLEYVTKAAVDRGILPVYWDNGGRGASGENQFALLDRTDGRPLEPELVSAIVRAATSRYALGEIAAPKSR